MRIGFDMLAVQSPHHGHRGIGRYCRNLVATLLERHSDHHYYLYAHEELPSDRIPSAPHATLRWLGVEAERGESAVSQYMDRLVCENPDELDVLVILSPFENWLGYTPSRGPAGTRPEAGGGRLRPDPVPVPARVPVRPRLVALLPGA